MPEVFDTNRFEVIVADDVHIAEDAKRDGLDVHIEPCALGKRFVRRLTVGGHTTAKRYGIYAEQCYFLREWATGRYFFLEMDARGFYLYSERFLGAQAYLRDEARVVRQWLADLEPSEQMAHVPRLAPKPEARQTESSVERRADAREQA
jgi:hypothetical protein